MNVPCAQGNVVREMRASTILGTCGTARTPTINWLGIEVFVQVLDGLVGQVVLQRHGGSPSRCDSLAGVATCRAVKDRTDTLTEACKLMIENNVSGVVVLDGNDGIAGIISKTDITRVLAS